MRKRSKRRKLEEEERHRLINLKIPRRQRVGNIDG